MFTLLYLHPSVTVAENQDDKGRLDKIQQYEPACF